MNLTCKLRYCPGCSTEKPSKDFSNTRNGYALKCKECNREERAKKLGDAGDVVKQVIGAIQARDNHITYLERCLKNTRARRDHWKEAALRYQKTIVELRKEMKNG